MMKYVYTAKNLKGEESTGEYIGTIEELKKELRGRGYFLSSFQKASMGKNNKVQRKIQLPRRVKLKDLAIFCRQFAVLFGAGVNIAEAINALKIQTENPTLKETLADIYEDIRKGKMLSGAMDQYKHIFPEFLRSMIQIGEASGNLDDILVKMADYYERSNKIKNKMVSAMIYPIVLLVLMTGVVLALMLFVLPIFATTLSDLGGELPLLTRVLMGISAFMIKYLLIWVIALVGLGILLVRWMKGSGKRRIDYLKMNLPIMKTLQRKSVTSYFARGLGVLLYSGIPMLDAIDIISNLIGNKIVEEKFKSAKEDVKKGYELSVALEKVNLFSPLLLEMISVGQKTGQLDDMLLKTANFFDEEVEEAIGRATTLIEPLMIIILSVVIGIVVLAIMLPMTSIMSNIS